jgi:hypothetical protein
MANKYDELGQPRQRHKQKQYYRVIPSLNIVRGLVFRALVVDGAKLVPRDCGGGGAQDISPWAEKRQDRRRRLTGWLLMLDGRDCFSEYDGHAAGVNLEILNCHQRAGLTGRDASRCGSARTLIINGQSESWPQGRKICIQGPALSVTNLHKYKLRKLTRLHRIDKPESGVIGGIGARGYYISNDLFPELGQCCFGWRKSRTGLWKL